MPKISKLKKVKAVFKGLDGSCGYRNNYEYELQISVMPSGNISIYGSGTTLPCEYDSMLTFLDNWDNIRNV